MTGSFINDNENLNINELLSMWQKLGNQEFIVRIHASANTIARIQNRINKIDKVENWSLQFMRGITLCENQYLPYGFICIENNKGIMSICFIADL